MAVAAPLSKSVSFQSDQASPNQASIASNIAKDFYADYAECKHSYSKGSLVDLDNYILTEKVGDYCEDNNIDSDTYSRETRYIDVPQNLIKKLKACVEMWFTLSGITTHLDKFAAHLDIIKSDHDMSTQSEPSTISDTLPFDEHKEKYNEIGTFFRKEISALVENKDVNQIRKEAENMDCVQTLSESHYKDVMICPCIERICVILRIYHKFEFLVKKPIRPIQIGNKLRFEDIYTHQQISDDFDHIRNRHFQNNNDAQKSICTEITAKYSCIAGDRCCTAERHKRKKLCELDKLPPLSQVVSAHTDYDEHDFIHSQQCDNIHYYFMHSQVKHGTLPLSLNTNEDEEKKEEKTEDVEIDAYDRARERGYSGIKEDKKWMDTIKGIKIKDEQKVYDTMVKHMGGFQWQTPFGFRSHRRLTHIKPKYKNVKEEVLQNEFYPISADSWNQTLRKCTVFNTSWAAKSIRTQYDGEFRDDVMHHYKEWKKDEHISLYDVIVLKLYTDFDKLQSELKKCFRLESMEDIVVHCSLGHTTLTSSQISVPGLPDSLKQTSDLKENDVNSTQMKAMIIKRREENKSLEKRLKQFYHWRGKLLIFLNKFSTRLSNTLDRKQNDFSLYHGINAKMMVSPDETTAFFGPLSTTSSYYVAKTFATDKGVVLSIYTQYPRLNMCRAFDASLMSDYPEEQEWLIGFIYLRVMKVYTKMKEKVPMESHMRFAFFAIHLFQKQLFSMNNALEEALEAFIQHQLFVRNNINRNNYKEMKENEKNEGAQYLEKVHNWAKGLKDDKPSTIRFDDNTVKDENPLPRGIDKHLNDEERARYDRVVYMLTKKFEQFCLYPNVQQIVKFDSISAGLRKYFLKDSGKRITLPKEEEEIYYSVSFKKIVNLFPNVEEIHFLNWYKFDDGALESFIEEIVEKRDTKLKQIKFLYFDYKDTIEEHLFFVDPDSLNKENMQKLEKNWKLKFSKDRSGCRIRIKPLQ